jgi:hypothetical protein
VIPFHRLLITTAIVFCVVFAAWGWREYQSTHTAWALASTIAFAVFAALLAYYLKNLKRFLGS